MKKGDAMRDFTRALCVVVALFAVVLAYLGCGHARSSPAPLLKRPKPAQRSPLPPQCVMTFLGGKYVTRFSPDGSYFAKGIGDWGDWEGTWSFSPDANGGVLTIRERAARGGWEWLTFKITLEPGQRMGRGFWGEGAFRLD